MVTSSVLASHDVDNERGVILEEIAMHDDDPGDSVHDTFAELIWPTDPLGRPVLGTVDSIEAMSRSAIAGYYRRRYRSDQLVITAAGNVDHATLVTLVKKAFADVGADDSRRRRLHREPAGKAPGFVVGTTVRGRPTEQANIVCGVPGLSRHDDRRLRARRAERRARRRHVVAAVPGGPRAARAGLLGLLVHLALRRHRLVRRLRRLPSGSRGRRGGRALPRAAGARGGEGSHAPRSWRRGKGQMRGGLVLGLEDTGSRMSRLGKAELVYGELMGVEEILGHIDAVTLDDTQALAADLLGHPTLAGGDRTVRRRSREFAA